MSNAIAARFSSNAAQLRSLAQFLGAIIVLCILTSFAQSAVIVEYTFDGNSKAASTPFDGVSAGLFDSATGNAGFINGNPSSGRAINDIGWRNAGNYYEFTAAPQNGFHLILNALTFDDAGASSSVSNWTLQYSVEAGPFVTAGTGAGHTSFSATPMNSLTLSAISNLQSVDSPVTFRIVGSGASNDSNKNWALDNVRLIGDTQALASLSAALVQAAPSKVLVGVQNVQHAVSVTNNAASGGTISAQQLSYTLGLSDFTGLSLDTNSGSNVNRGDSVAHVINVDTTTSGAKTGSLSVANTNAWQQNAAPALSTVQVYQAADINVSGGDSVIITNAAASDGASAQRAAARLVGVSFLSGDEDLKLSGLTAGSAGIGSVITAGSSLVAAIDADDNLLNGVYSATYQLSFEHHDQAILGASANDLGAFLGVITHAVADNAGHQKAKINQGRRLAGLNGNSDKSKASRATLLDGVLSTSATISMSWREADRDELLSDILSFSGINGDLFVLQINFTDDLAPGVAPVLGWFNDGQWINAVLGNDGGSSVFVGNVAYDPSQHFFLGYHGLDAATNTAWAVLNHNSDFAIIPEPATVSLLLLGSCVYFRRRLRK